MSAFLIVGLLAAIAAAALFARQHGRDAALDELVVRVRVEIVRSDEPAELPESDPDRPFELDVGPAPPLIPAHNLLLIEYCDGEGKRSRRRITVNRFSPLGGGDAWLHSYCHERRGQRTFYLSRISKMTDLKTGEVISDPAKYFEELFPPPVPDPLHVAFRDLEPELLILAHVARSGSRMVKAERVAICNFVSTVAANGSDIDATRLDKRVARIHCDQPEFKWAVKTIRDRPKPARERLLVAAHRVIIADEKMHDDEKRVFQLVKASIGL